MRQLQALGIAMLVIFLGLSTSVHFGEDNSHATSSVRDDGSETQTYNVLQDTPREFYSSNGFARASQGLVGAIRPQARRNVVRGLSALDVAYKALDDGSPKELTAIRPTYLHRLPGYGDSMEPLIRKRALQNLVSRFESQDWLHWNETLQISSDQASDARRYVRTISMLNPDLGVFLEISAVIFHRLFISVDQGMVYDFQEDVWHLAADADRALEVASYDTKEADRLLREGMLENDPTFREAFEKLKIVFIEDFISANPKDYVKNLQLLSTVQPQLCGSTFIAAVERIMRKLLSEASVSDRLAVFHVEQRTESLYKFALGNSSIRELLATLYALGAVDGLQLGDRPWAESLYRRSIDVQPGLDTQTIVADALYISTNKQSSQARTHTIKTSSSLNQSSKILADEDVSKSKNDSWGIIWWLLLAALLTSVGFYWVVSRRNRMISPVAEDMVTRLAASREAQGSHP